MAVTSEIGRFLADPELFVDYQRPAQSIQIENDTDGAVKREMIKTFALASTVYQDDLAERQRLPFIHHSVDDIALLKQLETEVQAEVTLVSSFEKFSNLLANGELDDEEMIQADALQKHMAEQEEPEKLMEFIKSERGGGGMAKCYPLSLLQSNFAFHEIK